MTQTKFWYATATALCGADDGPPLGAVCRTLGVTREAYYKRQSRDGPGPATDALVLAHVDVLRQVELRKGTRKLQAALATAGVQVGRDHLFATLRGTRRLVPRKRRRTQTTYSRHAYGAGQRQRAVIVCCQSGFFGSPTSRV